MEYTKEEIEYLLDNLDLINQLEKKYCNALLINAHSPEESAAIKTYQESLIESIGRYAFLKR